MSPPDSGMTSRAGAMSKSFPPVGLSTPALRTGLPTSMSTTFGGVMPSAFCLSYRAERVAFQPVFRLKSSASYPARRLLSRSGAYSDIPLQKGSIGPFSVAMISASSAAFSFAISCAGGVASVFAIRETQSRRSMLDRASRSRR
ncbi:hypothetical protein SDC9_190631 [bioreactor metagenome]|uniref:Uncharacterized protein n=1 Tax=bioreactor metagenome TaxID=1076179 RepID=A0A645HX61_9ZZZZ